MKKNEQEELPAWFVYDAQNIIDLEATLKNIPAKLDKKHVYFREVPEWFEVDNPLDDPDENLKPILEKEYKDLPAHDRKMLTEDAFGNIKTAMKFWVRACEVYAREGLSDNQKEVMRCLCYHLGVAAMSLFPQDDDELC